MTASISKSLWRANRAVLVVGFVLGLAVGISAGQWARVRDRAAILDWHSNKWGKLVAADSPLMASSGLSDPRGWAEMRQLDNLYKARTGKPGGGQLIRGKWVGGFGWFVYRTLVDPGFMALAGFRGPIAPDVDERIHDSFRRLARACKEYPAFGKGLMTLFESADYMALLRDDLDGWRRQLGAGDRTLVESQRRRALAVAKPMREFVTKGRADPDLRAAADLVAALTTAASDELVSVPALARIPDRYPKQKLIGLVSRYYLFNALWYHEKPDDALALARRTVKMYRNDKSIRRLATYGLLVAKVERPQDWF